ncbi:hypothetical protein [Gordonibacter sp.]|uniref:hypothetical protein n=1 Tax=Gordonibacter sp. TaxID=1968902 RepID=UPI002FCB49AF
MLRCEDEAGQASGAEVRRIEEGRGVVAGKLSERIQRVMVGRNGPDEFARFFIWVSFAVLVASLFVGDGMARWMLSALMLACLACCYFRMLSKNIAARNRENRAYLQMRTRVTDPFSKLLERIRQRRTYGKDYLFCRCEHCGQRLRVPKGKGSVKVTCPKCGNSFKTKS